MAGGGTAAAPVVVEGVVTANDTAMRRLTLRELGGDLETVISCHGEDDRQVRRGARRHRY